MADFLRILSSLREQMNATLSRTDVLRALIWPISVLLTATLALAYFKSHEWLLIVVAVLLVLCVILYVGAFIFCLINDRDALRSEKYTLNKMAIEHGLYGDSISGVIEVQATSSTTLPSVPEPKVTTEGKT